MPFYIVEDFNFESGIFDANIVFDSPIVDDNNIVINEDFKRIFADYVLEDGKLDIENAPSINGPFSLARIAVRGVEFTPLQWNEEEKEYDTDSDKWRVV